MKIRKYLWLLPLVALAVVGCTAADTGDDEPETLEPETPSTSDDPNTDEEPTPSEPEVVKYSVTWSADEGAEVVGLEESYEAEAVVTFTVNVTDKTKAVDVVAWNANVITADAEGVYSFAMPEQDVVVSVTLTDAPTPWTDYFGASNVQALNLYLNGYDSEGSLSFDYDVPYASVSWTNLSATLGSCNIYLTTTDDSVAVAGFEAYEDAVEAAGWTIDLDDTYSYSLDAVNPEGTIGIKLQVTYSSSGNSYIYYTDLYVYGLTGGFGKLITNVQATGTYSAAYYEEAYGMQLGTEEIDEVFPYVNPYCGYYGIALVTYYPDANSADSEVAWGLNIISGLSATYVQYYMQTYINRLYTAASDTYTSAGWEEQSDTTTVSGTSVDVTTYSWSKTEESNTYTLSITTTRSTTGTYAACFMFVKTTATDAGGEGE